MPYGKGAARSAAPLDPRRAPLSVEALRGTLLGSFNYGLQLGSGILVQQELHVLVHLQDGSGHGGNDGALDSLGDSLCLILAGCDQDDALCGQDVRCAGYLMNIAADALERTLHGQTVGGAACDDGYGFGQGVHTPYTLLYMRTDKFNLYYSIIGKD